MQNAKLSEDLAQHVEDTLVLPSDMGAVGKQCDQANDFYDPGVNEIQLCYESIQHSEQNFAGTGNPIRSSRRFSLARAQCGARNEDHAAGVSRNRRNWRARARSWAI